MVHHCLLSCHHEQRGSCNSLSSGKFSNSALSIKWDFHFCLMHIIPFHFLLQVHDVLILQGHAWSWGTAGFSKFWRACFQTLLIVWWVTQSYCMTAISTLSPNFALFPLSFELPQEMSDNVLCLFFMALKSFLLLTLPTSLGWGARLFHIRKNWLRWVFITSTRPAKIEHSNSSACIQCYTSNLHDLIIVIPMTTRLVQICNLFWMEGVLWNKAAINQIELCTRFAKNWIRDCWPGNCTVPTTDLALPIKICEEHEPPYCCIVRYNPVYDMHSL